MVVELLLSFIVIVDVVRVAVVVVRRCRRSSFEIRSASSSLFGALDVDVVVFGVVARRWFWGL